MKVFIREFHMHETGRLMDIEIMLVIRVLQRIHFLHGREGTTGSHDECLSFADIDDLIMIMPVNRMLPFFHFKIGDQTGANCLYCFMPEMYNFYADLYKRRQKGFLQFYSRRMATRSNKNNSKENHENKIYSSCSRSQWCNWQQPHRSPAHPR